MLRARAGTAHAPVPLGRRVLRPRSRGSLCCVVDNRHHVLVLQTSTSTALLQYVDAEWDGELVRGLHVPVFDARQPVADGLRFMASAHLRGNPPRAFTSPVAALSPDSELHLPSEAHWGRPKGRAGSKPADGPQPHSGCGIVAAAVATAASPQPQPATQAQLPGHCAGALGPRVCWCCVASVRSFGRLAWSGMLSEHGPARGRSWRRRSRAYMASGGTEPSGYNGVFSAS